MKRIQVFILVLILLLVFLLPHFLSITKVVLLVSQEFPQIPLKPLHSLTKKPKMEELTFGKDKKIKANLFLPNRTDKIPALIIAMGVRTSEKDKPILFGFSETLARLGYMVLWPRLEDLENKKIKIEDPQTFVEAFHFLQNWPEVDKKRVSFVGFSVGSPLALVAAQDPKINQNVRSIVFFGGYYNVLDYFHSLATKTMIVDSKKISWIPDDSAINHANEILEKDGLVLKQFANLSLLDNDTQKKLLYFSPDQNIDKVKARIFILHEKSDTFVPYVESEKLTKTIKGKVPFVYHQANLFEHVQPKKGFSLTVIKEFLGLFGFLYKVFMFI